MKVLRLAMAHSVAAQRCHENFREVTVLLAHIVLNTRQTAKTMKNSELIQTEHIDQFLVKIDCSYEAYSWKRHRNDMCLLKNESAARIRFELFLTETRLAYIFSRNLFIKHSQLSRKTYDEFSLSWKPKAIFKILKKFAMHWTTLENSKFCYWKVQFRDLTWCCCEKEYFTLRNLSWEN